MAKTTRPTHANLGVEAAWAKELKTLCAEFENSVIYWTKAAYAKNVPKVEKLIAQDASIVGGLNLIFAELGKRWIRKFDEAAPVIAEKYVKKAYKAADSAFMQSLIDAGFAVKFQTSPAVNEAIKASVAENIKLITNIPEEYLTKVQGMAMRSVMRGRDLESFTTELKDTFGMTQRRATLIARTENNKATAVIRQTRALENGITEAIWVHSGAGREPRPSHVKAGAEKKRFNIAEGCPIDGNYILAGELIGCRCSMRMVLPI